MELNPGSNGSSEHDGRRGKPMETTCSPSQTEIPSRMLTYSARNGGASSLHFGEALEFWKMYISNFTLFVQDWGAGGRGLLLFLPQFHRGLPVCHPSTIQQGNPFVFVSGLLLTDGKQEAPWQFPAKVPPSSSSRASPPCSEGSTTMTSTPPPLSSTTRTSGSGSPYDDP